MYKSIKMELQSKFMPFMEHQTNELKFDREKRIGKMLLRVRQLVEESIKEENREISITNIIEEVRRACNGR